MNIPDGVKDEYETTQKSKRSRSFYSLVFNFDTTETTQKSKRSKQLS